MGEASLLGTVLGGKYRLDKELGRGGMGVVYRAFHLRVHKDFAVKLLLTEVAEHKTIAQRFFLEAQAAGRIGHPGILDVYDVGETADGRPFIVMELLRGEPLAHLLRRERLDPKVACWIAMRVLDVLDAAHRAGVVHRDVKPQNVFLCEAPGETRTVKLLDFGIAKFAAGPDTSAITRSGEIIGSPLYMAPEQARGELDVDARVDVWSVGAMLFEMLTGTAAHAAPTPVAVIAKILTEPAPPPSGKRPAVPTSLDAIVQRALSIDRDVRFGSAREMFDALAAATKELGWGDEAPKFSPPVRPDDPETAAAAVMSTALASSEEPSLEAAVTNDRRSPRGRPLAVAIGVAGLAALVIVPFVVDWSRGDKTAPAASAQTSANASAAATSPLPPAAASSVESPAPPRASAAAAASESAAPAASSAKPPATPKVNCAPGEVLSNGHCCPRGLVYQAGHCERPLATSF